MQPATVMQSRNGFFLVSYQLRQVKNRLPMQETQETQV